jgi:uncharacterized membrane protein
LHTIDVIFTSNINIILLPKKQTIYLILIIEVYNMEENKSKDSVSVKEIEAFAKKHRYEMFFCLLFLLSCVFSMFGFFSSNWSIFCITIGSIIGTVFPTQIQQIHKKIGSVIFKQEPIVQKVVGTVWIIFSVFIPFLVYLVLGVFAGKSLYFMVADFSEK